MGSVLSVNPEIFRLDIRVAHAEVSTTAQTPDILTVLAVGASSFQPSTTSSNARRSNLTRFSPEMSTAEDHILYLVRRIVSLKRIRISYFFTIVCTSHLDMIFFQSEKRLM